MRPFATSVIAMFQEIAKCIQDCGCCVLREFGARAFYAPVVVLQTDYCNHPSPTLSTMALILSMKRVPRNILSSGTSNVLLTNCMPVSSIRTPTLDWIRISFRSFHAPQVQPLRRSILDEESFEL